jgi:hypothetical protein
VKDQEPIPMKRSLFLPIFGFKKLAFFLKFKNKIGCYDPILAKFGSVLNQYAVFSTIFSGENILKIATLAPRMSIYKSISCVA